MVEISSAYERSVALLGENEQATEDYNNALVKIAESILKSDLSFDEVTNGNNAYKAMIDAHVADLQKQLAKAQADYTKAEQGAFWARMGIIDTDARLSVLRAQGAAVGSGNFRASEQETALIPLKAAGEKMDRLLERFETETDPQMLSKMQDEYLTSLETIMGAVPTYAETAPGISSAAGTKAQYYLEQYDAAGIEEKAGEYVTSLDANTAVLRELVRVLLMSLNQTVSKAFGVPNLALGGTATSMSPRGPRTMPASGTLARGGGTLSDDTGWSCDLNGDSVRVDGQTGEILERRSGG